MRLALVLLLLSFQAWAVDLNIGGIGDGTTDETTTVQSALSDCSANGKVCIVESGKNYRVTGPLYLYGTGSLRGEDNTALISFDVGSTKYPIQIGLSSSTVQATAWSGTISDIRLVMVSGSVLGRLIWLARTSGATIDGVTFSPGNLRYSLTGSGVDGTYLSGAGNYVRENITITDNVIAGQSDTLGSEGIGLEGFNGASIKRNTISGVGDDLIGIHLMCTAINIEDNDLSGVDGRVFISNSQGVVVNYNRISRGKSNDGLYKAASSLIFVGHETSATNSNTAPKNIIISNNTLTYPSGALDSSAAIYMQGPRDTLVYGNTIYSDSFVSSARCTYDVPFDFVGTWTDPDGLDTTPAKCRNIIYRANRCVGKYPKSLIMTGAAANHIAPKQFIDNIGTTSIYSPAVASGGLTVPPAPVVAAARTIRD